MRLLTTIGNTVSRYTRSPSMECLVPTVFSRPRGIFVPGVISGRTTELFRCVPRAPERGRSRTVLCPGGAEGCSSEAGDPAMLDCELALAKQPVGAGGLDSPSIFAP